MFCFRKKERACFWLRLILLSWRTLISGQGRESLLVARQYITFACETYAEHMMYNATRVVAQLQNNVMGNIGCTHISV